TAFYEGYGDCTVFRLNDTSKTAFSNRFELHGTEYIEPTINFFSFNNPYGACPTCEGYGATIGIDPNLVIPDKTLSIYEEAILPWKGEKMGEWKSHFIANASKSNFPIHRPVSELNDKEWDLLW